MSEQMVAAFDIRGALHQADDSIRTGWGTTLERPPGLASGHAVPCFDRIVATYAIYCCIADTYAEPTSN
ncbi:hypothetical protein [Caballeronia choica]|jgi:hypothetical protein|uniref:hypothetical protein n=1 Tax=Caballeronia choica TaxID=326476 RepID=UPI000A681C8F|nr:hypothetical protein [Caballeronia choica]